MIIVILLFTIFLLEKTNDQKSQQIEGKTPMNT